MSFKNSLTFYLFFFNFLSQSHEAALSEARQADEKGS